MLAESHRLQTAFCFWSALCSKTSRAKPSIAGTYGNRLSLASVGADDVKGPHTILEIFAPKRSTFSNRVEAIFYRRRANIVYKFITPGSLPGVFVLSKTFPWRSVVKSAPLAGHGYAAPS